MAEALRIAIFSAQYLPHIGGVESYTRNLAVTLIGMGHKPVVVTCNCDSLPSREVTDDGIEVVRLPCFPLLGGRFPVSRFGRAYRSMLRALDGECFDGVLVNTRFYPHSICGLRFARRHHLTPIVLDHGSQYLTFGNAVLDVFVRAYEHIITSIAKRFHPVFCGVSKKSLDWLRQFGISGIDILPNAIDVDAYCSNASNRDFRAELGVGTDSVLACFVGRLIPEKGIDSLLAAMKQLNETPVKLVVAGDGPLRELMDSTPENVSYVGPLRPADVSSLLQAADVLCLPTRSEGFCTTLLESSACGTPAIIPLVGGVDEVFGEEDCGFLLDGCAPDQIAAAIRVACASKVETRRKGRLVQSRVREYCTWGNTAERLVELLGA